MPFEEAVTQVVVVLATVEFFDVFQSGPANEFVVSLENGCPAPNPDILVLLHDALNPLTEV